MGNQRSKAKEQITLETIKAAAFDVIAVEVNEGAEGEMLDGELFALTRLINELEGK